MGAYLTTTIGPLEARYREFLDNITQIRPGLHRYCARMTGSVLDGEDVVQEALFEAYRKIDQYDESRPLSPWLFRIAHNRCIDFLRRRAVRIEAEARVLSQDSIMLTDLPVLGIGRAIEQLVLTLPPKERAGVLLKDVFEYSLAEIAELVDSTVGGVKAALKRGRTKLAAIHGTVERPHKKNPELAQLLRLYVDRFNQRDWDGVRELLTADARLQVVDRYLGPFTESPYFSNYERRTFEWQMAVAEVDGELAIIGLHRDTDGWTPQTIVRLQVSDRRISRIQDYRHCGWVLPAATSVIVAGRL
jgi:RNA polymerase sigma-70 factor (ECF subfamily)